MINNIADDSDIARSSRRAKDQKRSDKKNNISLDPISTYNFPGEKTP